jgi:hypothetical protein
VVSRRLNNEIDVEMFEPDAYDHLRMMRSDHTGSQCLALLNNLSEAKRKEETHTKEKAEA